VNKDKTTGRETLVLCNTSQADRSYCIKNTTGGEGWSYGKAEGTIATAATATAKGYSNTW
jgi:hypothetical protein